MQRSTSRGTSAPPDAGDMDVETEPGAGTPQVAAALDQDDYYILQARLNPIDNRTGRRTRRRASPGPPTRSAGAADLDLLAATEVVFPPTEGIPEYRMNAVAVMPRGASHTLGGSGASERVPGLRPRGPAVKQAFSNFTLGRYLTSAEDYHPGWACVEAGNFNFGTLLPAKEKFLKIVNAFKCNLCPLIFMEDTYCCKRAGHMICRICLKGVRKVWYDERVLTFVCPICPETDMTEGHKAPDWSRFLTGIDFQCDFVEFGCEFTHLLPHRLKHREGCTKAWNCLYCGDIFPLTEMENHLEVHGLKLPQLVSDDGDSLEYSWKLEAPFDGLSIRTDTIHESRLVEPLEIEMGLRKFEIKGVGTFVLYQIKMDAWKYAWFLVLVGNEKEASEYEVKFLITAAYETPEDESTLIQVKRSCVSKVYPWNSNMKKLLKAVSDENDGMLAVYNFDRNGANDTRKGAVGNGGKRMISKVETGESTNPSFKSSLTLTIRKRSEFIMKKRRRFYTLTNVIKKRLEHLY